MWHPSLQTLTNLHTPFASQNSLCSVAAPSDSPSMQSGLRSASMQEGQADLDACSTPYSHAHGRLQTDQDAWSTVTVAVQGSIDPYRFNMFMSDLLAERGSDIKRMHGILSIQGYGNHGTHFKFEGAQQTVRFGPTVGSATDSQVTFCGHYLSATDLQEALDSCTWLPVAPGWTEHFATGILQPFYIHQATGYKQWHRPAAVETEPVTPSRCQSQSPVAAASYSGAAQLSKSLPVGQDGVPARSLQSRTKQKRNRSPAARSSVSCPCDASDACAAVFDIKCKEDLRSAKRMRNEEVTSLLAEIDIKSDLTNCCTSSAIIDSASELEAARTGQGKLQHRQIGSHSHSKHNKQRSLRRSSSCPWTPEQTEVHSPAMLAMWEHFAFVS